MDTQRLSYDDTIPPTAILTTTLLSEKIVPGAGEWLTRLISRTHSQATLIPESTPLPLAPYVEDDTSTGMGQLVEQEFEMEYPPNIPQRITMEQKGISTLLLVFIPVLVVILTVLIGLICFLVAVILMRRKKGVRLTEDGGPLDLSKGDGVIGEGGVEGVEQRWLETVEPDVRDGYRRAKGGLEVVCVRCGRSW